MRKNGIEFEELSSRVIGCALEVHRELGPGLFESAYETCLGHELNRANLAFMRQVTLPISYKSFTLDCGYRIDLVVEESLLVELKCVEKILPIHEAQILTYLKLSRIKVGLLMNFNERYLKDGLKRFVM